MLQKHAIKKLLIVDDDVILQNFLLRSLASTGYMADCLTDGGLLPSILQTKRIDLIILDVELPNRDGYYWLKWLQHYHPQIPVIMASVRGNEHERLAGLEIGARDYLLKPFQFKELLIRIENILGSGLQSKNDSRFVPMGCWQFDTHTGTLMQEERKVKLTAVEASILKLLYINEGSAVSRDEIMEQTRGSNYNPLDRSIDIHINKLRKKIEADPSAPVCIYTVRGKGYRLQLSNLSEELIANS